MKKVLLNLVFLFALVCFAEAQEFKVADIFSDNMVLQQKINNPFWGWGKPGTKVTISTSWNPDKEYTGVVNSKGTWIARRQRQMCIRDRYLEDSRTYACCRRTL